MYSGNPPKMGIHNSKHFQVMWNHLRMGFFGVQAGVDKFTISNIIRHPSLLYYFSTNPRFTGHQRFFMYKCRMVANCMLTVLLWRYSWKGIVVDVVGRVMTTRMSWLLSQTKMARTNRHRALSSWVLLVRRHIMLRFWAELVFHWHLYSRYILDDWN